jgi:hypothetical protein
MNAKKSTSFIILSLASITLLASCGSGKEIKRADAETLLDSIIKNTPSQTKVTVSTNGSGDTTGTETDVVNLDDKFIHSTSNRTSGGTSTKIDTYVYLSNSVFYTVDAIAKTYTKESNALAAGAAWELAAATYKVTFMNMTSATATSALSTLKGFDSSEPTDVTESYHSTGDGNLTLTVTQTKDNSSQKAGTGTSIFNKNLLVSSETTSGSNKYSAKYTWGTAKVAIPSLSGYTEK